MACWPGYRDGSIISPCFNYTPLSKSKYGTDDLTASIDPLNLPSDASGETGYVSTQITGFKCQCYTDLCNHPYPSNQTSAMPSTKGSTGGRSEGQTERSTETSRGGITEGGLIKISSSADENKITMDMYPVTSNHANDTLTSGTDPLDAYDRMLISLSMYVVGISIVKLF